MDRRTISMWGVGVVEALLILLLPLLMVNTGSAMTILLVVIPLAVLVLGVIAGILRHPLWLHPLIVAVCMGITVVWHLSSNAWVYVPIFGAISFIGVFLAWSVRRLIADSKRNQ